MQVGCLAVMVQLFNDPKITPNLINDYNLLELFIGVFSKVINFAAQKYLFHLNLFNLIFFYIYLTALDVRTVSCSAKKT